MHKYGDAVARQVDRIMADLRQRYTIAFEAPADDAVHALDVRVAKPGVTVRGPRYFQQAK